MTLRGFAIDLLEALIVAFSVWAIVIIATVLLT